MPGRIHTIAVLALAAGVAGQAPSQARLIELREGKLGLPFLKKVEWVRSFDDAKSRARRAGRFILAYFTRSDEHCDGSIMLECGVLSEPGFAELSRRVVPFCHITTRVKGEPDPQLLEQLGLRGWPQILFLDADGRVLYRVRGERLGHIEKGLAELEELRALQKRVASGDRKAGYPLLVKQLELQLVEYPAAQKAQRGLPGLGKAEREALAPLLLNAEVRHLAAKTGTDARAREKTGERFHRMRGRGAVPTGEAAVLFGRHILYYAEARKKPELYEEVLDALKQEFPRLDFSAEERTLRKLQRNPLDSAFHPHPSEEQP